MDGPGIGAWTIEELASRAAAALADLDVNGRVQDVPGERLIRWYTTLGLLDPPQRRGRRALYTPRHLLQLVAVKRRQASGMSLAEIQAELISAPDQRLAAITGEIPDVAWSAPPSPAAPDRRFWTVDHRAFGTGERHERSAAPPAPAEPSGAAAARPPVSPASVSLQGIRLAPGVTLLLQGGPLSGEALAALHGAAAPLLAELEGRGLLPDEGVGAETP